MYTPNSVPTPLPSERKFGLFFSLVFLVAAAYAWRAALPSATIALIALAVGIAILAQTNPNTLRTLNRLWFELGILIGRIVNPIVLGILFFVLITPFSFATRLLGRDELHLKKRQVISYWIKREPIGPAPESFKNQF